MSGPARTMAYNASTRTALRTAARLGLLSYMLGLAWPRFWLIYAVEHIAWGRLILLGTLLGPTCVGVAVWASGAEARRRTALTAAWLMGAVSVFWAVAAVWVAHAGSERLSPLAMWDSAISLIWPLALIACLQASYRGRPLGIEENSAPHSRTWWQLAGVLAVAAAASDFLDGVLFVGQPLALVFLLIAGLAYREGRNRRSLVGAADWRTVTVLLAAPFLPTFVFDLLAFPSSETPWFTSTRWIGAAVAAIGFAAVAAAALRRRGSTSARRSGSVLGSVPPASPSPSSDRES